MKRYLWVVETQNRNGKWGSVGDGFATRRQAAKWRDYYWARTFPLDRFRVVKYTPAE